MPMNTSELRTVSAPEPLFGEAEGHPGLDVGSGAPIARGDSVLPRSIEQAQIRIMLASYSDILFVLMPFILVLTIKLFREEVLTVLASPEFSLASAVLAGLAVVKLMMALASHDRMSRFRERLVFMVAATTFMLLMPSLLLAAVGVALEQPPMFLVYVQPVLLIVAIAVYSGAVHTGQTLLKREDGDTVG